MVFQLQNKQDHLIDNEVCRIQIIFYVPSIYSTKIIINDLGHLLIPSILRLMMSSQSTPFEGTLGYIFQRNRNKQFRSFTCKLLVQIQKCLHGNSLWRHLKYSQEDHSLNRKSVPMCLPREFPTKPTLNLSLEDLFRLFKFSL